MLGVYVHIPFCKSRCIYCDFVSSTHTEGWQRAYVEALGRELRQRAGGRPRVDTVYIGGGTPSSLPAELLGRVLGLVEESFQLSPSVEFTLEANPDDVGASLGEVLSRSRVNRISLGVQTLSDPLLSLLGRRHNAEGALAAIEALQGWGYSNLSADLIYGLPRQSVDMFGHDVETLLATGIPHLSAYALQVEEGTRLFEMVGEGELVPAGEEASLRCYERLLSLTREAGMEHYELSNFALPGFRSRHNSSYWTGAPYMGFGCGAHSYDGGSLRSWNTASVAQYVKGEFAGGEERLTEDELYDEMVMLSLRTREGLSLSRLGAAFGEGRLAYCLAQAEPHLVRGTLVREGDSLRLSASALMVSNAVISDLFA